MRGPGIARALRNHSLPALIAEAGWRGIRSIRKSSFQLAGQGGACPIRFHPIGYYPPEKDPACEAILGLR